MNKIFKWIGGTFFGIEFSIMTGYLLYFMFGSIEKQVLQIGLLGSALIISNVIAAYFIVNSD